MVGNQQKSYTDSPSRMPNEGTIGSTVSALSASSYTLLGLRTKYVIIFQSEEEEKKSAYN